MPLTESVGDFDRHLKNSHTSPLPHIVNPRPGFGRMQIVVLLVCGTIIMTVLTETMGMGLIMTAAHCDMQLDATRKGILSSVTFIGMLHRRVLFSVCGLLYWLGIPISFAQEFCCRRRCGVFWRTHAVAAALFCTRCWGPMHVP